MNVTAGPEPKESLDRSPALVVGTQPVAVQAAHDGRPEEMAVAPSGQPAAMGVLDGKLAVAVPGGLREPAAPDEPLASLLPFFVARTRRRLWQPSYRG
jgi:hypothetical protein